MVTMTQKINLSSLLGQIKAQVESTSEGQVKSLLGDLESVPDAKFTTVFGEGGLAALKEFAESLGVAYAGQSLAFWESEDGVGCRPPAIQSNGKDVVVNWGGVESLLPGDQAIAGKLIGDSIRLSSSTATLRLELRIDSERFKGDGGKSELEDLLAEAETWGDLLPVLRAITPYRNRKALFEQNNTITVLESALVEKDSGNYLSITGQESGNVFRFSLPEDAKIGSGDIVEVDKENHVLRCNGTEYASGGFLKMGELAIGKTYRAIERKESGGEYGGFYLVVPGTGNVNCNSQFERWYAALGCPEISKDNPVEIQVVNVKETRDGKRIAKLTISQPNNASIGLGALLGGVASATPSTPAAPPVTAPPVTTPVPLGDNDW